MQRTRTSAKTNRVVGKANEKERESVRVCGRAERELHVPREEVENKDRETDDG